MPPMACEPSTVAPSGRHYDPQPAMLRAGLSGPHRTGLEKTGQSEGPLQDPALLSRHKFCLIHSLCELHYTSFPILLIQFSVNSASQCFVRIEVL
jgi:hypothetical protein